MKHINWNRDRYDPNYQPKKGDWVFVDFGRNDNEIMNVAPIEKHWDNSKYPMSKSFKDKVTAFRELKKNWEFGQPRVEIV